MNENGTTSFLKMLNTHNLCVSSTFRMKASRFVHFTAEQAGAVISLGQSRCVRGWGCGEGERALEGEYNVYIVADC